jgi:hypothetical protein
MMKKVLGMISIIVVAYLLIFIISLSNGSQIGFIDATLVVLVISGIVGFALLFSRFLEWCFID